MRQALFASRYSNTRLQEANSLFANALESSKARCFGILPTSAEVQMKNETLIRINDNTTVDSKAFDATETIMDKDSTGTKICQHFVHSMALHAIRPADEENHRSRN